jgi:hypothetical protein
MRFRDARWSAQYADKCDVDVYYIILCVWDGLMFIILFIYRVSIVRREQKKIINNR